MSMSSKNNPKSESKSVAKVPAKVTSKPVSKKVNSEEKQAPASSKEITKKPVEQTICIVRIRGSPGMRRTILNTLQLFNLHKVHHATLVRSTPSVLGMLQKAKDYIAYGPISFDILKKMLKKRALLIGNKPLTDAHVKITTNFDSIDNLANGLIEGKVKIRDVKNLKPIFRLHPPIGGFPGSIKWSAKAGGVLGNLGDNINALLKKML